MIPKVYIFGLKPESSGGTLITDDDDDERRWFSGNKEMYLTLRGEINDLVGEDRVFRVYTVHNPEIWIVAVIGKPAAAKMRLFYQNTEYVSVKLRRATPVPILLLITKRWIAKQFRSLRTAMK